MSWFDNVKEDCSVLWHRILAGPWDVSPVNMSLDSISKYYNRAQKECGSVIDDWEGSYEWVLCSCTTGYGAHEFVVLIRDGKSFVTLELGINSHIFLQMRVLPPVLAPRLTYHGQYHGSLNDLFFCAVSTLEKFGEYTKFVHNSPRYCKNLLAALQAPPKEVEAPRKKFAVTKNSGGEFGVQPSPVVVAKENGGVQPSPAIVAKENGPVNVAKGNGASFKGN